jgi:nitrogen fixation protein NifU and related proteins
MSPAKDLLMEHFSNPRNVGEIADADGTGDVGNPMCGDIVRLYLKIKDDKIEKATFKTFGCRAAIATSSILTEMVKGKTLTEALKLKENDMLAQLGDLPPLKRHCGKLAELALQSAIGDYYAKTKKDTTLKETVARRIQDPREWRAMPEENELTESL